METLDSRTYSYLREQPEFKLWQYVVVHAVKGAMPVVRNGLVRPKKISDYRLIFSDEYFGNLVISLGIDLLRLRYLLAYKFWKLCYNGYRTYFRLHRKYINVDKFKNLGLKIYEPKLF